MLSPACPWGEHSQDHELSHLGWPCAQTANWALRSVWYYRVLTGESTGEIWRKQFACCPHLCVGVLQVLWLHLTIQRRAGSFVTLNCLSAWTGTGTWMVVCPYVSAMWWSGSQLNRSSPLAQCQPGLAQRLCKGNTKISFIWCRQNNRNTQSNASKYTVSFCLDWRTLMHSHQEPKNKPVSSRPVLSGLQHVNDLL